MNPVARRLYRLLLALHPAPYREFSRETLRDFDEILALQGTTSLFMDGFLSLARQWTASDPGEEAAEAAEFSLLNGSYVALAHHRLTFFDLLRGSVLSAALFFWFGVGSTPGTARSLLSYLHHLL